MPEKTTTEKIAELLDVTFLPLLDPSAVKSLQRSLPGYQAIADDAARFAQKHGAVLRLDEARVAVEQGLAEVNHLEPIEHLLEKLYLSIYHQRLQATGKCMEGLYEITRRIRDFAEAYPEIEQDGRHLIDFMKAFKPGPTPKKEAETGGTGGA